MESDRKLSIVSPCKNEESVLDLLVERLMSAASPIFEDNIQIVLVDDGSTDGTWAKIRSICNREPSVSGLSLSRCFGQQAAITAGLSYCVGDYVLIVDADLQDPPELIEKFVDALDSGYDVAYGRRSLRKEETFFKRFSASCFYRVISLLTDFDIPRNTGDFRMINKKALSAYLSMPESHRYIRGMIAWLGFKQTAIDYERDGRVSGKTKYNFTRMVRFASDAITSFSVIPLRLAGILGIAAGFISLALFVYIFASFFFGEVVSGWASLAVIVTFFGSVQLLSLSVIGEYVGRNYIESKRRPLYFVQESVNLNEESE